MAFNLRVTMRRHLAALLVAATTAATATVVSATGAQADTAPPDHLLVSAVFGANSDTGLWQSDWIQLYNPTSSDIQLGTLNGSTVTSSFALCYRGAYPTSGSPAVRDDTVAQKCSTTVKLWGTVKAHHYFLVWEGNSATTGVTYGYPAGITPDIDATATAKNAGGQKGSNMGGCNTGGQVLLVNPSSSGYASFKGDLASSAAKAAGLVDAVGWTNANTNQPDSAEAGGNATTITGLSSGTTNACVIQRTFTNGVPVDSDVNRTDFTTTTSTAGYVLHSQISDHVAVAKVSDTEISRGETMAPLQVQGTRGTGALHYAASGLPDGLSIDPGTGAITGTPASSDPLQDYPVTVTVTDSTPTTAESVTTSFTLTVSDKLRVAALDAVTVHKGSPIAPIAVIAHGGSPAYAYSANGLPGGVEIDPTTGAISGTPTDTVGSYTAHVTVTDSGAGGAAQSISTELVITELPRDSAPGGSDPIARLRINEVKTTGDPSTGWIELHNTGAAIAGASVSIVDRHGISYTVPVQDVAADAYVTIAGAELHAAGLDLAASDMLYLTGPDDSVIDQTSWTASAATSWARYPNGTGAFAVSRHATEGTENVVPADYATDHLVVTAVYGADGTTFNSDWVELYNPTDAPISLGTLNSDGSVTANYYQCYRGNAASACSSMALYGTVQPHHHFLIWNGHNNDDGTSAAARAHDTGVPPAGVTPDLDFRYGTNDSNTADTKATNDPSGQANNGFGGCSTGGQIWLLGAASGGVAPVGDLSTAAARAAGVVDGVGWTATGITQPSAAESNGSTKVTGLNSGTNNACVITRRSGVGYPIDTDANSTDFTTVQNPDDVSPQSQTDEQIVVAPVRDAEISLDEQVSPIRVAATKVWNPLTYAATGLPTGLAIDPTTGVISGTATSAGELGTHTVTVTVTDGIASDTSSVSFVLTVSKVLRLDAIADVSLRKGTAFPSLSARAHGGTPGYAYSATGLPADITLDPSTGLISGIATAPAGHYRVHVTVTDSMGATASQTFSIAELPRDGTPAPTDPLTSLRINEVRASGTPAGDWVEIYNTGAAINRAAIALSNTSGDTFAVPAQDIAAGAYVVVSGADLHAAGLDLASSDTLYLAEADDTVLDETTWTSYAPTSWARTTDGTGTFDVSSWATRGARNAGAPVIGPNDLLVSEVNYDNNSTDYFEYSEITNTTDHPIDFAAYGLSVTKSGAVMSFHDPSSTAASSPVIDPVIPAHGTQIFWWVETNYLGVKTTAQFRSNYGLAANTSVVLVYGFSSMANSGGDRSFYISVNKGSALISRSYVDTPCSSTCNATNNNYAEHYAVPADRSNPEAATWYNSLHAGGDDIAFPLGARLSTPGAVDLAQVGFSRAVRVGDVHIAGDVAHDSVTLTNGSNAPIDLSGYVLQDKGGDRYALPAGTTVAAQADLVVASTASGLDLRPHDYVTLLAPRGYTYADGLGVVDTTGPYLKAVPYDAATGGDPVIDETTGLPLPPAGGLYRPGGIAALDGTVYVSNTGDNVLAALENGSSKPVAGSLAGYGELGNEGPAVNAQLYQPTGVVEDSHGNVYVADSGDNVIRQITTDKIIHRYAGTGIAGGAGASVTGGSTALTVNLWHPNGLAVDAQDNLYVADTNDNRVLKVTPAGAVTVVAGTGRGGYTGDGTAATGARLAMPSGVAVDVEDNVYIADSANNVIRRVDAVSGVITTVAGDYAAGQAGNDCLGGYSGDGGPATSAQLNDPQGVAVDTAGNLFIADTFNHAIRQVTPDGVISTSVNVGGVSGPENISPVATGQLPSLTRLNTPTAVAVDPVTNVVYLADTKNNMIAQVVRLATAGNAGGPTEPAAQIAITGSGVAAAACAIAQNGALTTRVAPAITGTPAVGSTLTADPGTWKPSPDSVSYQWLRDGVAIGGARGATYVVARGDAGHLLSVSVTAAREGFASGSATAAAVAVPANPSTTPTPSPSTSPTTSPTTDGELVRAVQLLAHDVSRLKATRRTLQHIQHALRRDHLSPAAKKHLQQQRAHLLKKLSQLKRSVEHDHQIVNSLRHSR